MMILLKQSVNAIAFLQIYNFYFSLEVWNILNSTLVLVLTKTPQQTENNINTETWETKSVKGTTSFQHSKKIYIGFPVKQINRLEDTGYPLTNNPMNTVLSPHFMPDSPCAVIMHLLAVNYAVIIMSPWN